MQKNRTYLFASQRLGFRNWQDSDVDEMTEINTDPKVMEFFPGIKSKPETIEFIERMKKQFAEKSYCYFAVEVLDTGEFIGFIGLSEQTYDADFTPCVDIGWRLKVSVWNKGFATEGAVACLNYGFKKMLLKKIVAVAPEINKRSEAVMKNIGMIKVKTFVHPLLQNSERLKKCVLYEKLK